MGAVQQGLPLGRIQQQGKGSEAEVEENNVPISSSALENISKEKKGRVDDLPMKRCSEAEEETEGRVDKLSTEINDMKEMFSNKMCEMQKDLLAMVEHCLNFEKELS